MNNPAKLAATHCENQLTAELAEAKSLLEFVEDNLQMHSPKMDGTAGWRFRNHMLREFAPTPHKALVVNARIYHEQVREHHAAERQKETR